MYLQVDLILPEEIYMIIEQKFNSDENALRYARVKMSLPELLSGEFFNQYIKAGWQYLAPKEQNRRLGFDRQRINAV